MDKWLVHTYNFAGTSLAVFGVHILLVVQPTYDYNKGMESLAMLTGVFFLSAGITTFMIALREALKDE